MACFKSTLLIILAVLILQLSGITSHGGSHDDDDESSPATGPTGTRLQTKGLILVKIWCLIIMFVATFVGGVSPYFYRWNESFLMMGTQFAGGVFLGTALMHFLSDSNATFEDLTTKEYPFSFMLASAGYLLTMLGDCVIAYVVRSGQRETRVDAEGDKEAEDVVNPVFATTTSVGDTILLILALCFHSVFEGIAVGVADTKADAWRNLWTISLHKIFAAIAMGIALLRMIPKRPFLATVAYSFAFAISSPIGVGIGIALDATTQGRSADWTYAITMGLACGVFVYRAEDGVWNMKWVDES
ncbi:hypothetical protein DH2020_005212 [Rehmannia glutinosa]|uniref:Uncharacterized protein n=1 Tax=Rehmannia glutinosa TaxID=99300 RepID=A0ABR0W3H1_REHGL